MVVWVFWGGGGGPALEEVSARVGIDGRLWHGCLLKKKRGGGGGGGGWVEEELRMGNILCLKKNINHL
jgi:hypothetical protein